MNAYFIKQSGKINKTLERLLPSGKERPLDLHRAMRYAVFSGGKRIRPILALEACRVVGGKESDVLSAACGLELIHNYSLIHDDLPCMDNDGFRRGRPACHRKFSEVTALLAGDALLTLAFGVLVSPNGSNSGANLKRRFRAASIVAEAIGSRGMVGGQHVDMEFQGKEPDLPTIEYINVQKSGALIASSVKVGAILGGGSEREVDRLYQYGKSLGLLFQIVDDILDKQGYAKVIGSVEAANEAQRLLERAKHALLSFGPKARVLGKIADFVMGQMKYSE